MTGFGEVQRETVNGVLTVQVRTVNHRHFHTHFRLPPNAERWEAELTAILREGMARGHVHYRIALQEGPEAVRPVEVDHGRVVAYVKALEEIKQRHGLGGEVNVPLLARFGDIFQAPTDDMEELGFEDLAEATRQATAMVVEMREREGAALAKDLTASLTNMEAALEVIEARAPERLIEERNRMREAVAELSEDVQVDEERLAREIAFLAERWDINEELVRLRSHIAEFRSLLEADGAEPAGKRMGFWVQEMHREANTIGSKANDAEIARQSVEIKAAIEKLREQVENVE
jgi:uncharacterized protein (TIGR00255 family)